MPEGTDEDVRARFLELRARAQSLVLATVGEDGTPLSSYAPFVSDGSSGFVVYVSTLAAHTSRLIEKPTASVMLIADEAETRQIFARTRITYQCDVVVVDGTDSRYGPFLDHMGSRFGKVIKVLRTLPDFILLQLVPKSGRLVVGFGQAYDLVGASLDELRHVGPDQLRES